RRAWTLPRVPWRALSTLLMLAAVAVVVPPALRAVEEHPYFAVREIVIHHHGRLPEAEVREALGIRVGDRIWRVDTAAAEARLRGRFWVRSARVRRELPDRVGVHVREYRPAASLARSGLRP